MPRAAGRSWCFLSPVTRMFAMRAFFQSSGREDFSSRAPDGASASETYGGENLPVLLRIPALSGLAEARGPDPVPSDPSGPEEPSADTLADHGERREQSDPVSSASSGERKQDASAALADQGRERRLRRQRHSRRERTTPGSQQPRAVSAWVRGTGQFAFAAVLAGVLLAAIIALRGRDGGDAEVDSEPRWVDRQPSVDAADGEVDQRQWERAAAAPETRGSDLLLQTLAGHAAAKRERAGTEPTSEDSFDQGRGRGLLGYGDDQTTRDSERSRGATAGATVSRYPTTDVEPVTPARRGGGTWNSGEKDAGWRDTPPRNPVRSADRRSPPGFEQRR